MVKKFKGFKVTAILTMLCVCIAYFSLLSSTTAYFYVSTTTDKSLEFDLFNVSQTTLSTDTVAFDFPGATKFADFNEPLFDNAVRQRTVTVTNVGAIPARVYVRLAGTTGQGLHYIALFSNQNEETPDNSASPGTTLTKGVLKQEVEDVLNAYNPSFVDGISQTNALEILNGYNGSAYATLQPNESVEVTIVFWVEYDEVKDVLAVTG